MLENNRNTLENIFNQHQINNFFVLIDFSWLMISSYHSFKNLSVNIGDYTVPTGMMFGITSLVERVLKKYPTAKIIFVMDSEDGTKARKEIYPDYKGNREKSDEKKAVYSYTDKVISILSLIPNIYFAKNNSREADDVISQLSFDLRELGKDVLIHSSDKDFYQLIQYGINVSHKMYQGEFEIITEDLVFEKFGVQSKDLLKFRAMEGDESDNISPVFPYIQKKFIRKIVALWSDTGSFNGALQRFYSENFKSKSTKESIKKLNENKQKLHVNLLLMNLIKYQQEKYQFEYDIFKGNIMYSRNLIQDYQLNQFNNFLDSGLFDI